MRAGEFLGQTIDVVEIAIRLVLVLLVELGIVEAFIVEFARRVEAGGGGSSDGRGRGSLSIRVGSRRNGGCIQCQLKNN
jgi:hypothetical protein